MSERDRADAEISAEMTTSEARAMLYGSNVTKDYIWEKVRARVRLRARAALDSTPEAP